MDNRKHLFSGTSSYYAKYRIAYPEEVFEAVLSRYPSNGTGTLLDLGCGTGEITVPLASHFNRVYGLDINSEMLEEARNRAEQSGIHNIEWKLAPAEEMENHVLQADLITAGNSFHWMDRAAVLESSYNLLKAGGGLVVLAGGSVWNGESDWQGKTVEVIQRYLGKERKAGKENYRVIKPHEDYIAETPFTFVDERDFVSVHTRTIEEIIGYLFSTSFSKAELFGERVGEFQAELTEELLRLNPEGAFQEKTEVTCFFLRKQ